MKELVSKLKGKDVLDYIEIIYPKLKDEFIIINAQYDHLGIRGYDIGVAAD